MEQDEIDRIKKEAKEEADLLRDVKQLQDRVRRIELGAGGFIIWVFTQFGDKISHLLNLKIGGE